MEIFVHFEICSQNYKQCLLLIHKQKRSSIIWLWRLLCYTITLILNGLEHNHVTYAIPLCVLLSKYSSLNIFIYIHSAKCCDDIEQHGVLPIPKDLSFNTIQNDVIGLFVNLLILIECPAFDWPETVIISQNSRRQDKVPNTNRQ